MVVYISEDVFLQARTDYVVQKELKHLFTLFEKERLRWHVRPTDDEDIFLIPALSSFYDFIKGEITESYKRGSSKEPLTVIRVCTASELTAIVTRLKTQPAINTQDVVAGKRARADYGAHAHEFITVDFVDPYLTNPLQIVVENSESDGYFLKLCYRLFRGGDLTALFVNIVSGGGSTTKKILDDWAGTRRVMCVVDGDTIAPGVAHPDKAGEQTALRATCDTYGFRLKVLEKRAIENYLPDIAIKRHRHGRHPYFALSDVEKDHFNMKEGYQPGNREVTYLKGLTSTGAIATALHSRPVPLPGFGLKIWKAFSKVNTKAELESRDRRGELQLLVDTITELV